MKPIYYCRKTMVDSAPKFGSGMSGNPFPSNGAERSQQRFVVQGFSIQEYAGTTGNGLGFLVEENDRAAEEPTSSQQGLGLLPCSWQRSELCRECPAFGSASAKQRLVCIAKDTSRIADITFAKPDLDA